ncbi:MAG: hypothetical protein MUC42_13215 [Bryobacter sp.]|nr:hypothetical protein [Bryobacter sp.]
MHKTELEGNVAGLRAQGFDTSTGAFVEVEGEGALTAVEEQIAKPQAGPWLAPGFVDIQVNGCAGADYNDPKCPLDRIARSLEFQFSAGVTRLFPTLGGWRRFTSRVRTSRL